MNNGLFHFVTSIALLMVTTCVPRLTARGERGGGVHTSDVISVRGEGVFVHLNIYCLPHKSYKIICTLTTYHYVPPDLKLGSQIAGLISRPWLL